MTRLAFFWPRPWALALLAATACHSGYAATTPASPATEQRTASTRIAKVTVYPGSATVERVARVAAGARSFTFSCLPASLDSASLQVQADAAVRVGEFHIETKDRDVTPECASPLEGQIRSLEDQIAQVKAEMQALQLAQRYLGNVAGAAPDTPAIDAKNPTRLAPASAAQVTATAEALRQSSQEAHQRQHQLERRQQALELALKPLVTEQSRTASQRAQVVSVTVNLATVQEAELRLSYQVRGPSWQPSYRAALQADKSSVQLERLALVAQSSGEDWNNVQLTLSTGQPGRATQGRIPRPWTLDLAPPPRPAAPAAAMMMAPAPAPAMRENMAAKTRALVLEEEMPSFDVSVLNKGFATEFAVPQRISVPSSGQRVTLALGSQQTNAQLFTRIAPAEEEAAYLVAQLQAPPGVWPAGPVGLYRDGAFVGNGRLDFAANTDHNAQGSSLWFGRDELVLVRASAPEHMTSSTGLTGARTERRTRRSYQIDNRHNSPVTLQVLHAAPVSRHEKIEVESHYQPAPHSTAWNGQQGTIVWQQPLAAGASASFSAEHTIRHHKELELLERR